VFILSQALRHAKIKDIRDMSINTVLIGGGVIFLLAVIIFGYREDYKRNPRKFIRTFLTIFVLIVTLYSFFWFSMSWMK
jgi:heme/copper-type cytochrome/quinol oxidase subunit 2